jgi:hypothetical protein
MLKNYRKFVFEKIVSTIVSTFVHYKHFGLRFSKSGVGDSSKFYSGVGDGATLKRNISATLSYKSRMKARFKKNKFSQNYSLAKHVYLFGRTQSLKKTVY